MKSLLLFAAASIAAASVLSSCQQDPSSAAGSSQLALQSSTSGGTVTWNAHPQIAYPQDTTIGTGHSAVTNRGLWVMDSTGLNWKCIYYTTTTGDLFHPTWSPTGASICWRAQSSSNSNYYYIQRIDVSTSNGVPVGSNMSTIYTHNYATDSNIIMDAEWSSVSSNNVVAFALYYGPGRSSKLQTIPATGGTPTVIYSDPAAEFVHLTWSPDGSRIAIALINAQGHYIRVVDLNGNVKHEYAISGTAPWIEYARTSGTIAWGNYGYGINKLDTASGTSTRIGTTAGGPPCFSPTDYKIVYSGQASPYPISTIRVSAGDTTQIRSAGGPPNWRRQ